MLDWKFHDGIGRRGHLLAGRSGWKWQQSKLAEIGQEMCYDDAFRKSEIFSGVGGSFPNRLHQKRCRSKGSFITNMMTSESGCSQYELFVVLTSVRLFIQKTMSGSMMFVSPVSDIIEPCRRDASAGVG